MSQNNMVNFITLTDLDAGKIEINPTFIVMMKRDTYEPEEGVEMPFTKIYTSSNHSVWCIETPEEIAQLQMAAATVVMETVLKMTTNILEQQFEEEE